MNILNFFLSFFLLFTLPKFRTYTPGTYNPNARGSDAWRGSNSLWTRTLDIQYIHKDGPPWMCGQDNSRTSAGDNTGQNPTNDTHPNPGQILKFLTLTGIEPGSPHRRKFSGFPGQNYLALLEYNNHFKLLQRDLQ